MTLPRKQSPTPSMPENSVPPRPQPCLASCRGRQDQASRRRAERLNDLRDCSDLGCRRRCYHCPLRAWVRSDEGRPPRSHGVKHDDD